VKRKFTIALRIGISLTLVTLLFREHDFSTQIAPRLISLLENWPWVICGLFSAFMSLLACATRWHVILRGCAPQVSWRTLARTEIVAAFFNISSIGVIGGDTYKIMSVTRRLRGQAPQVGVSLMLDHVAGFVAVGLLFFSCFAAIWPRWEALGHDAKLLLTGFSGFMGVSFIGMIISWITFKPKVLAWGKQTFPRILGTPFFERISSILTTVHDVILVLWRRALGSILVSIAVYGFLFFTFYCALRAVGSHAPLLDVMTAMPVVDASATLPISLSGIGVREKTFEALLSSFAGVPESACISAAFVGWLFTIFWGLIGGGIFLKGDEHPVVSHGSTPTTIF
jgi:uncharacterized membrane protein YbhN (UPF0104 family)